MLACLNCLCQIINKCIYFTFKFPEYLLPLGCIFYLAQHAFDSAEFTRAWLDLIRKQQYVTGFLVDSKLLF